jgi:ATP-dependent Clp protease adaptor protein ClpS
MTRLTTVNELDELLLEEEVTAGIQNSQLIVYNDDFNTFDWVIQCFIEVCGHSFEQSEQLSLIIHFKGKAIVKTGAIEDLKPIKEELINRGLSAVVETFVED